MALFCPKCKGIMMPKKTSTGKIRMVCTCGYTTKDKEKIVLKEKIAVDKKNKINIIDKDIKTDPKTKVDCPKCSHGEAYYWLLQTRAADEPETTFFRCVKCKHQWRSYD
ncbi:transcription factor S [Candidatus Woesearchaeota archaeon]|nr:transcription factor S [Candidatus Woesearchaeota archaeon]